MPFSSPAQIKFLTGTTPVYNALSPFRPGQQVFLESEAGDTVYGANHPGDLDTTKYAKFKQTISGNKAFTLPSAVNAPYQVTGGALANANLLRVLALVDGVLWSASRSDQVAAASKFVVGAGGGTAVGASGVVIETGGAAAGATQISIKRGDAGTETILVGDKITIAGDSTVYRCTETSQALNGTTAVVVDITPPLQAAAAAGAAVTIAASDDRTLIFVDAPRVGADVEVFVLDSTDITTISGGALTAGRIYESVAYTFMCGTGTNTTNVTPVPRG